MCWRYMIVLAIITVFDELNKYHLQQHSTNSIGKESISQYDKRWKLLRVLLLVSIGRGKFLKSPRSQ